MYVLITFTGQTYSNPFSFSLFLVPAAHLPWPGCLQPTYDCPGTNSQPDTPREPAANQLLTDFKLGLFGILSYVQLPAFKLGSNRFTKRGGQH